MTHAGEFSPSGYPLHIGDDVTVGHSAIIHACTIKNTVLIGMGSIILDGAMGSELIRRGETLPNYIWSADSNFNNSELVYQIHKDYIDAGSSFITTNTFRTTPRAYRKTGLSKSDSTAMAHRSLNIAVRLANQAAKDKLKI